MSRHMPNPVEPLACRHCDKIGLRYQGSRQRPRGGLNLIYKCIHCRRSNQNPGQARKAATPKGPLCPRHEIPVAEMQRLNRLTTMPWSAAP
jgi:hypothetical protein